VLVWASVLSFPNCRRSLVPVTSRGTCEPLDNFGLEVRPILPFSPSFPLSSPFIREVETFLSVFKNPGLPYVTSAQPQCTFSMGLKQEIFCQLRNKAQTIISLPSTVCCGLFPNEKVHELLLLLFIYYYY